MLDVLVDLTTARTRARSMRIAPPFQSMSPHRTTICSLGRSPVPNANSYQWATCGS
ncbi:hypothetical protein QGN17_05030 [Sphingomonas sp. MAHUQ-71]|uniref:Uncharacterized protein n=1 Tax=Sphingomonas oryzagri TaxID=3042314 RepID=A0ABT6MYE9_9SPHN|nr:hypothetical protein [Sphingomonas oryzagri]MDH7638085.1 hypothetical protein [Sphingomonas oryzagri]